MIYMILHNPRCSKSREALKILDNSKVKYEIREYLKNTLDAEEIKELQEKLWLSLIEFTRTSEPAYKEHSLSRDSSDDEILKAMIQNPKLIERPIVYTDTEAVIGRPPENIISFIKKK